MVSSFDPHSMCAKVERITAKTGCTSCINWTISFKVRGFQTKTHVFQKNFIFPNLFKLKTFLHPTCSIQIHILKFQPFLTSFDIFHAFNDLFWAKRTFSPGRSARKPYIFRKFRILYIFIFFKIKINNCICIKITITFSKL